MTEAAKTTLAFGLKGNEEFNREVNEMANAMKKMTGLIQKSLKENNNELDKQKTKWESIKDKIKNVLSSAKLLNVAFTKFRKTISAVTNIFFNLKTLFIGLFAGAALNQFNNLFIRPLANLEKFQAQLKALGATDAQANAGVGQAIAFGRRNPIYDLEVYQKAMVQLKASGIEPLDGSLQSLVDAVAAFGGSSEDLKLTVLAVQQIAGKGVASMEELRRQMGERIPSALKILARELDLTMPELFDKISSGSLESKIVLDALFAGFNKDYKGAAKELLKTWEGVMAKLAFTFYDIRRTVLARGGIFEYLKEEIVAFTDKLSENKEAIGQILNAYILLFGRFFKHLFGVAGLKDPFDAFLQGSINLFNFLNKYMSRFVQGLKLARVWIIALRDSLAVLFKPVNTSGGMQGMGSSVNPQGGTILSKLTEFAINSTPFGLLTEKKKDTRMPDIFEIGSRIGTALDTFVSSQDKGLASLGSSEGSENFRLVNQTYGLKELMTAGGGPFGSGYQRKYGNKFKSNAEMFWSGWNEFAESALTKTKGVFTRMKDFAVFTSKTMFESLSNAFNTFFMDAIEGRLKSFKDYLLSFLKDIAAAISAKTSDYLASQVISAIGSVYKGGKAETKSVASSGAGTVAEVTGNRKPIININNNSGMAMSGDSSVSTNNMGQTVVDIWLDAAYKNKSNIRSRMKGMRL